MQSPLNLFDIEFKTTGSIEDRVNKLVVSPTPTRNVYSYFRGLFQTRIYIGNRQVCIAYGTPQQCIRMADCALYFFWPYRRKPDREIRETDLHCGIEAAGWEINNNAPLRDHLCSIESDLIGCGAINTEAKRKARGRVTRAELFKSWSEFKSCLESVKLTAIEKSLGAYEDAITEQIGSGQNLVYSIDRQIFNA